MDYEAVDTLLNFDGNSGFENIYELGDAATEGEDLSKTDNTMDNEEV